ncbi:MAG: hypothetical protein V3S22_03485 [Candidatus Neomarinimicrobiota bacterium]
MRSLLILFLPVAVLLSGHPGDDIVKEGVRAFYNYEFERSIQILNRVRRDYPENPIVHLTWVGARWKFNEANSPSDDTYSFLSRDIDEVDSVYTGLLEKYPDHPEYMLYLGSTRGLKARYLLGQKKWFSTLAAAFQGFQLIKHSAELDPELKDACLPLGILEYYAGLSNFFIKSAASLFGLEPSRFAGLEKMEMAADKSQWAWIEAKSVLSYIYLWMDADPYKGEKIAAELAQEFPQNYDFQIHYIEGLLQTNKIDQAEELLRGMEAKLKLLTSRQQVLFSSALHYEWGHYYFITGNYKQSLVSLEHCISEYRSDLDAVLSFAFLRKGMILDLQDNRKAALSAYESCRKLDNFSQAIVLSQKYLERPYTQATILEKSNKP